MKILYTLLIVFVNYANGERASQIHSQIFARRFGDENYFTGNITNKHAQPNSKMGSKNQNHVDRENNFSNLYDSENRNPNINPTIFEKKNNKVLSENVSTIKHHLQPTNVAEKRKPFSEKPNEIVQQTQKIQTTRKPLNENADHYQQQQFDKISNHINNGTNNKTRPTAKRDLQKEKTGRSMQNQKNIENKHLQKANVLNKQIINSTKVIYKQPTHQTRLLREGSKNARQKMYLQTKIAENNTKTQHQSLKGSKTRAKTQKVGNRRIRPLQTNIKRGKTIHVGNKHHTANQLNNKWVDVEEKPHQLSAAASNDDVSEDVVIMPHSNKTSPTTIYRIKNPPPAPPKNYWSLVKKVYVPSAVKTNPSRLIASQRKQKYTPRNNFEAEIIDVKEHLINQKKKFGSPFKVIQFQKEGLFLDLEDIPTNDEQIMHNHSHKKCLHYELNELKLLKITNKDGRVNTFYVFPRPISGGATSKVFHASPIDAVDMDGKSLTKCVAIKSVILDFPKASPDVIQGFEKEEHFLMMFRNNPKIKHIVHLHYMKRDYEKNRLIIILELGKHDLTKRMKLMRNQWKLYWGSTKLSIDDQIKKLLRQVLEALNELHTKAIHLDLKADNLLFVEQTNEAGRKIDEVLKIIDFGGSEIIDPVKNKSHEASEVANVCRLRKDMWSDDRYSSPEQNIVCAESDARYPISTKSDIWSIGIMLIEFLLLTPHFPEIDPIVIRQSSETHNIYNVVLKLNHWHYSMSHVLDEASKLSMHYMSKIHDIFPFFYKIIKACLVLDPTRRPTAKGILDFLDGKCQFYEKPSTNNLEQNEELVRRKKRSASSLLAEQNFQLFSKEILGRPLDYCDVGI